MKPDYLWDRSGEPDPEIEHLERLLGALRSKAPRPVFPESLAPVRSFWFRLLPVAAALILIVSAVWMATRGGGSAWQAGGRAVRTGEWLQTDARGRVQLRASSVGQVEIGPNSRVRLLKARRDEHRFAIERGQMRAEIWAPPRLFYVDTPSAVAIDLGCVYTLKVEDDGAGRLNVDKGWVGLEWNSRESFIPAGASCLTRPGAGPGTPFFRDASPKLQRAVEEFDFENGGAAALDTILAEATWEDTLTLWHLLPRVKPEDRGRVYDRMAELESPPDGVTREGIVNLDAKMLQLWWSDLHLGGTAP